MKITTEQDATNGKATRGRLLLVLGIIVFYTLVMVQWSTSSGRLAQDATHDDVGYLRDGLARLEVLHSEGLLAVARGLFSHPPHSPYSSMQCFLSFALFGVNETVVYLLNGGALFLVFWFYARILRGISGPLLAILLLCLLPVPLFKHSIHELRPDFMVAVLTMIGCYYLIRGGFQAFSESRLGEHLDGSAGLLGRPWSPGQFALFGGVFIGFALIAKPTIFAHTAAMAALSAGLGALEIVIEAKGRIRDSSRRLVKYLCFAGIPALLIPLPYYVFNFSRIFGYFWSNTRTGAGAQIWHLEGAFGERFVKVLLTGEIGGVLGPFLIVFLVFGVLGLLAAAASKRMDSVRFGLCLTTVILASVVIFTYGSHNNMYFGMTFQLAAIALCLTALVSYDFERLKQPIFAALCAALACVAVFHTAYPLWTVSADARGDSSVNAAIVNKVVEEAGPGRKGLSVFVGFTGWISADSMGWLAEKRGLPITFVQSEIGATFDEAWELSRASDFIAMASSDTAGVFQNFPCARYQRKFANKLNSDPGYEKIATIPTSVAPVALYRKSKAPSEPAEEARRALNPDVSEEGLLPREGPYPQWDLPFVRWGIFPESRLTLDNGETPPTCLRLSVRGDRAKRLQVIADDKVLQEIELASDRFTDVVQELPSPCISIVLKYFPEGKTGERSVLLRELALE